MAKKSLKKSMYPLVAIVCAALLIVSVFLPFVTSTASGSVLGVGDSSTTKFTGFEFIQGLFADKENDDLESNVYALASLKTNEDAGGATTTIMIAILIVFVLGIGIAVLGVFGVLQPKRKDMVSLSKALCFLAAVASLVALFVCVGLAKELSNSIGLGGLFSASVTYKIAIGAIMSAVGGVGGVVAALFVK